MNRGRQVAVVVLSAMAVLGAWAMLAIAQQRGAAGRSETLPARYTVVESQGHNLLVTDNAWNKFYFYTVDRDKPIGSPLKLRASLDLNQVGKPEIAVTE